MTRLARTLLVTLTAMTSAGAGNAALAQVAGVKYA